MKTLNVAVIREISDYKEALTRIDEIYDAKPDSDEF